MQFAMLLPAGGSPVLFHQCVARDIFEQLIQWRIKEFEGARSTIFLEFTDG